MVKLKLCLVTIPTLVYLVCERFSGSEFTQQPRGVPSLFRFKANCWKLILQIYTINAYDQVWPWHNNNNNNNNNFIWRRLFLTLKDTVQTHTRHSKATQLRRKEISNDNTSRLSSESSVVPTWPNQPCSTSASVIPRWSPSAPFVGVDGRRSSVFVLFVFRVFRWSQRESRPQSEHLTPGLSGGFYRRNKELRVRTRWQLLCSSYTHVFLSFFYLLSWIKT